MAITISTASSFVSYPKPSISSCLKMIDKPEIEVVPQPSQEFLEKKGCVKRFALPTADAAMNKLGCGE